MAEWFPCIVMSSIALGFIPKSLEAGRLNNLDWVPVDVLAEERVHLTLYRDRVPTPRKDVSESQDVENLYPINLKLTAYQTLLPAITSAISTVAGGKCQLIATPACEWVENLSKDVEAAAQVRR